jgi:hypothetical protein
MYFTIAGLVIGPNLAARPGEIQRKSNGLGEMRGKEKAGIGGRLGPTGLL